VTEFSPKKSTAGKKVLGTVGLVHVQ